MKLEQQIVAPLEALSEECLRAREFRRLRVLAELLVLFVEGGYAASPEFRRLQVLHQMQTDFGERFWTDKEWRSDSAYTQVCLLVSAELRRYAPKQKTA